MVPAIFLVVFSIPLAPGDGVDAADDVDADAAVVDTAHVARPDPSLFAVGVHLGAAIGVPYLGLGVGLHGRVQLTPSISVEPHVDGAVLPIAVIAWASAQAGVPVVVSFASDDARFCVGAGPVVSSGFFFGHFATDPLTAVGGEVFVGTRWQTSTTEVWYRVGLYGGVSLDGRVPAVGLTGNVGFAVPFL